MAWYHSSQCMTFGVLLNRIPEAVDITMQCTINILTRDRWNLIFMRTTLHRTKPPSFATTPNENSLKRLNFIIMPQDPWLSAAKSLASTASGVAGVPGLSAGVGALCALISLCEEVSANRNATRQLCERCHTLLLAVEKYEPQPPNTLKRAFDDVTKCITDVKNRVQKWGRYPWARVLINLKQVQEDIETSQREITDCFLRFQLASSADTNRWQTEFANVARSDHEEVLVYLSEIHSRQEIETEMIRVYGERILYKQDEAINSTKEIVANSTKEIMAFMQENMGAVKTLSINQYASNLYELQVTTKTLLPNPQLVSGEITDVEERAVTGTSAMDIFRGRYLHRETVAIKVMRSLPANERIEKRFMREALIWERIYQIDHGRYLLPFYGFGHRGDLRPYMVSPWQENGNALAYVKKNDATVDYKRMITDIAQGMRVLHSFMKPPVIHGDLRAANIFIDSHGNPLIGDFGLSKMVEDMTQTSFTRSDGVDSLYRWFAPEIYGGSMSLASDVYSFGMTILELLTHQHPYSQKKQPTDVVLEVIAGKIPPRPTEPRVVERGLDDVMWSLLVECWGRPPSVRPSIEDILKKLEESP
ncbi:kinase-like protein [Marasmius fiardii PR-910]|nr:kinase-like protein [Marasmius fiardii PR-910]